MSPLKLSLVLILFLGHSLVVADYEEDSQEEDVQDQESPSSDESEEPDDDDDDLTLTKSTCTNALQSSELTKLCCHNHLHLDKASQYCNENENMSDLDFDIERDRIQGIMRLVACFFRRKKYIKLLNRVNMDQVRADAAKFRNPAKTKFMVNMYKTCEEEGKRTLRIYKQYPKDVMKNLQGPDQLFKHVTYACLNNYFLEKSCPYFYWFSEQYEGHRKCQLYAKQCKKLVN